jgi:hypothetical protein
MPAPDGTRKLKIQINERCRARPNADRAVARRAGLDLGLAAWAWGAART